MRLLELMTPERKKERKNGERTDSLSAGGSTMARKTQLMMMASVMKMSKEDRVTTQTAARRRGLKGERQSSAFPP